MRSRKARTSGGSVILTGLPMLGRLGLLDFVRIARVVRNGKTVLRHVSRLTPEELAGLELVADEAHTPAEVAT